MIRARLDRPDAVVVEVDCIISGLPFFLVKITGFDSYFPEAIRASVVCIRLEAIRRQIEADGDAGVLRKRRPFAVVHRGREYPA